jgi:hypothetical protein
MDMGGSFFYKMLAGVLCADGQAILAPPPVGSTKQIIAAPEQTNTKQTNIRLIGLIEISGQPKRCERNGWPNHNDRQEVIVMATTTLSPDRDLNQSELAELEALVDAVGIEAVLQGLSEICGAKAEHIASAWQDTPLAKRWATLEGALGVASTKATGL